MILTFASSGGEGRLVVSRARIPPSSQAVFHITVAQEIIDLRDAADGTRDILSEAPTVSDSFASARPPPWSFLGSGSQDGEGGS
jgi:hypothetical protein